MSVSTFRRKVENVLLKPVNPASKGEVRRFRETEVLAVAMRIRGGDELAHDHAAPADDRGKIAARVFTLLDDGVHKVDVVKQLELDPLLVEELHGQWVRMRGMFVLTVDQVDQVDALVREWTDAVRLEPARSAEQLLARLGELRAAYARATRPCADCRKATPEICFPCRDRRVDIEKTRRQKMAEDAKTERARYAADTALLRPVGPARSPARAPRPAPYEARADVYAIPRAEPQRPPASPKGARPTTEIKAEWFDPNYKFPDE